MKEEVKKVLKMIEEGHITAEEGQKLMEAIHDDNMDASGRSIQTSNYNSQFVKIRISDGEKAKVNVSIPLSLVEIGLKIGEKIGPKYSPDAEILKEIDFDEIIQAIKEGARGKLVDIDSGEGQTVEIFVE